MNVRTSRGICETPGRPNFAKTPSTQIELFEIAHLGLVEESYCAPSQHQMELGRLFAIFYRTDDIVERLAGDDKAMIFQQ